MSERITQKKLKHDEFVDAAFDLERWFEANWRPVAAVAGGVVALAMIAYGWTAWKASREAKSLARLGEALGRVETAAGVPSSATADWSAALPAFEEVARSGSDAAATAEFYRGVALVRSARAGEAVPVFETLAAGDGVVADLARAKLAVVLAETGQTERAVTLWKEIAADADAVIPPDVALYHAADALASLGRTEEAKAVLQDLLARYQEGSALVDARALQTALGGAPAGSPAPAGAP